MGEKELSMSNHDLNDDRLIDAVERRRLVPYSDMHIWRLERAGKFPARIKLGPHRVAWRLSEILLWVEQRASQTVEVNSTDTEGGSEDR